MKDVPGVVGRGQQDLVGAAETALVQLHAGHVCDRVCPRRVSDLRRNIVASGRVRVQIVAVAVARALYGLGYPDLWPRLQNWSLLGASGLYCERIAGTPPIQDDSRSATVGLCVSMMQMKFRATPTVFTRCVWQGVEVVFRLSKNQHRIESEKFPGKFRAWLAVFSLGSAAYPGCRIPGAEQERGVDGCRRLPTYRP
jgi:hypothetical protein